MALSICLLRGRGRGHRQLFLRWVPGIPSFVFLEESLPLIKDPTYLIIESNHDIRMLLNTNRPFELKNRIMSDHGHLCNEDSAIAAVSIIGEHTKEIVLAHLSEEANTPETALYLSIDTPKWLNIF